MLSDLHLSGIRRLVKKAGCEKISREALEYLLEVTEKFVLDVAKLSLEESRKRGGRLINIQDVKTALKKLKNFEK